MFGFARALDRLVWSADSLGGHAQIFAAQVDPDKVPAQGKRGRANGARTAKGVTHEALARRDVADPPRANVVGRSRSVASCACARMAFSIGSRNAIKWAASATVGNLLSDATWSGS